jgi:hypothetical protein
VPQNQVGYGLSIVPQNDGRVMAWYTCRDLVEASQARVSQSGLKTGECTMAGGARGTIAEVTSKSN